MRRDPALPDPQGCINGDPVQPRPRARAPTAPALRTRTRKVVQRVSGIGFRREDAATGRPHRPGVSPQEQFEGRRVPIPRVPPQQFPVGDVIPSRYGEGQKTGENRCAIFTS